MSIYAIPSFFALVIKAWLLWYSQKALLENNRSLGFLLLALFCLNFAEFNLFFFIDRPDEAMGWMRFYWVSVVLSVSGFLYLSGVLSGYFINYKYIASLSLIMIGTILFSNVLIAGAESIGYSVTRIQGTYYFLLPIYILFSLTAGLSLLGYAGFFHKNVWTRKKCSIVFLAMLPTVLAVFVVLSLMQSGIHVNATVVVSVTIIIFLLAIIFTETKYSLLNLLRIAPLSKESRYLKSVLNPSIGFLCDVYSGKKLRLKDQMKEIEMAYIMAVVEENNGDKLAAAKQLGISKSGIHAKIKQLSESN
jgi:regulatory Fis family protein